MTSTTTQSRFSRGGDAALETEEALRASRGGASFRKTHYLPKIGPGNTIYLRYLTDSPEWTYAQAHPGAPTKPKPADWPADRKFPESMPAVCRYDKAFQADPEKGWEAIYNDCYICDAKLKNSWGSVCNPVVRVWALAILREEVIGTQEMVAAGQIPAEMVGKRVGLKDATREVEVPQKDDKGDLVKGPDGKVVVETVVEPAIIVVNQAVSNFFAGLQSMYGMYGSVVDRDFALQQRGEGQKVEYYHMPLDPIDTLKPGQPSWQRYIDAIAAQGESVDIEFLLNDRSSDEYFATFFDPSKTPTPRKGAENGNTNSGAAPQPQQSSAPVAQQEAAPSNDPASADMLAQMRERVRAGSTPAAAAQETPQPTETAPAQAPAPAATGPIDFS